MRLNPEPSWDASLRVVRTKFAERAALLEASAVIGPVVSRETLAMPDHTYRITELVGSSEISHADAIENAITRASKTIRQLRWFEVTQFRGEIEEGEIRHYQVTMKVGFTLEDPAG
jgi:flavin-binding protein dodecin